MPIFRLLSGGSNSWDTGRVDWLTGLISFRKIRVPLDMDNPRERQGGLV